VLFELGRFGNISDICRDILSVSTNNLEARLTLAEYHLKKGEHSLAAEHLIVASENHADSIRPTLELARLYIITDEKNKLRELLDKFESRLISTGQEYKCTRCNFISSEKVWLCPSCQAVNSFVK
jgi:lipopolysaccharide biosynthesis regulator YciM